MANRIVIRFAVIMIFILAVGGFASCGFSGDGTKTQTQTKTLNFRITWTTYSGRGEALSKIVDSYNKINKTNYKINVVSGDENLDTIESLLAEGKSVDIYMLPYRFVQYLGYQNKIEDLTDPLAKEQSVFYEKLWQLGMVNQKLYGMPWLGHSMALIYNKQLLDAAGVDPAGITSVQDLLAACEKVEKNTNANGIGLVGASHNDVSWMVNQFIYGFGGSLVSSDGSKVTINSKKAKAAIEFYKNKLGKVAQPTWTTDTGVEVMDYFREQKVAFEIQGPWGISDIIKNGSKFETGVISLGDIGLNAEVGPMMLSLQPNLDRQKKNAAIDFIKYLISPAAQEMIMDGEYSPELDAYYPFRLPVRKDIVGSEVFVQYSEYTPFMNGYIHPSIDVPVPLWQQIKDQYYTKDLHLVMQGKLSIDTMLNQIQEEGDKILKGKK